jgi:hypothetical protein
VRHANNVHDVDVTIEHQRSATTLADSRDDVGPARRDLVQLDGAAPVAEDTRQQVRDLALTWPAGDERWVSRVYGYQRLRESDRVAPLYSHR